MSQNIANLSDLLNKAKNKINSQDQSSYSFKLINEGLDKINRKIGEEAIEVIIAAFAHNKIPNDKKKLELIGEISDLLYHVLILMIHQNITFDDIIKELNLRSK